MPSIFSWRPSKLQIRLKKLSYQLGSTGNATNASFQSSDDEDNSHVGHYMLDGMDEAKQLIIRRPYDSDLEHSSSRLSAPATIESTKNALVVPIPSSSSSSSMVSPQRPQPSESSISDDEFFCAKSPRMNTLRIANSNSTQSDQPRRAVRFSEEITTRPQQPPVCNVAPTNFASQSNSTAADNKNNDGSLQFRSLTSPVSNAAALPPRYSPALTASNNRNALAKSNSGFLNNNNNNSDESGFPHLNFTNVTTFDSTSENDTGGEYDEHENRRPPRPTCAKQNSRNKANIILQHLRSGNNLSPSTTIPQNSRLSSNVNAEKWPIERGFIFLEFNDEVKRSTFPSNIHSIGQIKSLFLRTFPNLSLEYLNQPHVKIYIQESTKSHLFYELDDIKDVKEHSLLKIREQQSHRNFKSPPPLHYLDRNVMIAPKMSVIDYLSEPEMDYAGARERYRYYDNGFRGGNFMEPNRPASVLPRMEDSMRHYPTHSPLHFQMAEQRHQRNLMSPLITSTHSLPLPRMGTSYERTSGGTQVQLSAGDATSSSSTSSLSSSPGVSGGYNIQNGAYIDPYYASSDFSRLSRSGSTTPVMMSNGTLSDDETRQRVDTMECQLAGLSTLVHSALITREMNPVLRQEMLQLQKQILELQAPITSTMAGEKRINSPIADFAWFDQNKPQIGADKKNNVLLFQKIKSEVKDTQEELRQLRRLTQINDQSYRDLLADAMKKIREELSSFGGTTQMSSSVVTKLPDKVNDDQAKLDNLKKTHMNKLLVLQTSLRTFETSVEEIRNSVLNSNRKLKMIEVEQLTGKLTQIGKESALLKTRFPELQTVVEKEIQRNMENIVRDENFIKKENEQIDECLRRCKNLANMMITMKKLAMVQDPSLKSSAAKTNRKSSAERPPIASTKVTATNGGTKLTGVATTIQAKIKTADISTDGDLIKANALDNILDELNYSPSILKKSTTSSTLSVPKSPPKPPERKRYHTAEIRLQYESGNGMSPSTLSTEMLKRGLDGPTKKS